MAQAPDPYRTLGLARGASLDEVKRAYRRLAKANHPDAAGEAALPRFLAIQAAYDEIVGPGSSSAAGRRATPRQPWDADPARADATRRAYGGRARRTRSTGPSSSRPRGSGPATGATGQGAGMGAGGAPGGQSEGGPTGAEGGRRGRPPNKATLGSTSYDGAETEPFEPDWGGASWYGTTSGTYWTLNPKEYADPRKHGPEYQARARRAAAAERAARGGASEEPPAMAPPPPTPGAAEAGPATTHTTASWWEATAGEGGATVDDRPDPPPPPGPASAARPRPAEAPAAPATPPVAAVGSWLEAGSTGLTMRVGRAVLGWAPVALGIGWVAGEVTGCARFAADCDAASAPIAWFVQVAVLGLLLLVPRLAVIASLAAIAAIVAAVPAALLLSATGDAGGSALGAPILGGVLVIAWSAGLVVGVARELRRDTGPVPAGDAPAGGPGPGDPGGPVS